jgi:hypothetical protein
MAATTPSMDGVTILEGGRCMAAFPWFYSIK